MKDTRFSEKFKLKDFEQSCVDQFTLRPPHEANPKKVLLNTIVSVLFNLISITTAFTFLIWLVGPFSPTVQTIAFIIGPVMLVCFEYSKRYTFTAISEYYTALKKAMPGLIVLGLFLFAGSATVSYIGGKHLPTLASPPPAKIVNPEITQLESQIATIDKSIKAQQATTWKGKVTTAANRNIAALLKQKEPLQTRLLSLRQGDDISHSTTLSIHNTKIAHLGYVTGIIAILSDIGLFFLLFRNTVLRYEVARMKTGKIDSIVAAPSGELSFSGISSNNHQERPTIGFKMPVIAPVAPYRADDPREIAESQQGQGRTVPRIDPRDCQNCGRVYQPYVQHQKYCCEGCKTEYYNQKRRKNT